MSGGALKRLMAEYKLVLMTRPLRVAYSLLGLHFPRTILFLHQRCASPARYFIQTSTLTAESASPFSTPPATIHWVMRRHQNVGVQYNRSRRSSSPLLVCWPNPMTRVQPT
uniref:Uncharacterized protein n=1 Tax=Schistocephalus solidus TaxID=70667 RepID=A0A0X3PEV2_SCHSO